MKTALTLLAVFLALTVAATADKHERGWTFFDDFNGDTLDADAWQVGYKQWGGKDVNGGVHPDNVEVSNGTLKLKVNGDRYSGEVKGVNKDMSIREDGKRVGSAVATRKYFASGSYEIKMKVAPVMGVCSALWTFNYEEYYPGDEEYDRHCKDSPIKCNPDYWASNAEIDMEFPTALTQDGTDISFSQGRLNSWFGENPGEYESNFQNVGGDQADGQFHIYRFDWHTGDYTTKQEKKVEFYVDDKLVRTISGEFTPTVSGQLWLGAWFPYLWAGNPDFDTSVMEIDYVKITPFYENGDDWMLPSYPDLGWDNAYPFPQQEPFFEDFSGDALDPSKWLVIQKTWGGQLGKKQSWNGGLRAENVKLRDGNLILEAHGNLYDGDLVGYQRGLARRNDGARVGAGLATAQYYGSGKYEVRMKIAPEYGVCTAMWTFNYEEYYPPHPNYYKYCPDKPEYCVVNHEVDFEMPTSLNMTDNTDHVSFKNGRMNVFVGETDDKLSSDFVDLGFAQNDGQFHTYRFDWHTGGDGQEKRVEWYLDDKHIHTIADENVPTNAGRLWLAAWFPRDWAGVANFNTTEVEIDWMKITPFKESGDTVLPETYALDGFAQYQQYPTAPHKPQPTPMFMTMDENNDNSTPDQPGDWNGRRGFFKL
eukprot:GFYU01000445.1.p2 GENE.GFYU01000445.1~~GFYU01000445.1.p2  ORF type:complete len:648 (-),score=276.65 GFYU01000445.1:332-2275(-)